MANTPTPAPPASLKRIGRYRIVRPLSKGGMALVYEARRESLAGVSPRVAIKVILPEHQEKETFKELFINEARLGAKMHHQNLVQIQDFDQDGEKYFLVMEYVEGLTLRRICSLCTRNNITIPLSTIAELGRQACDGLAFAHRATDEQGAPLNLVHRDVKPSNLILNPQGIVKLLDFGISRGTLTQEKEGAVRGTWGYMAPEQAFGKEIGPATDIFGLATVLYELASLTPLFTKKKQADIKRLLQDDHAIRMAATLDRSYQPLVDLFMRALKADPNERFSTAASFGSGLAELVPDPISARDELVRFYTMMVELNEGREAPTYPELAMLPPSDVSDVGRPTSIAKPSQPALIGAMAGGALVVAMLLAFVLSWLNQPPPGVTRTDGVQAIELPAVVTVGGSDESALQSSITISVFPSDTEYEVFIDGQFVQRGVVQNMPIVQGTHEVTITTTNGRQKRFTVEVPEDGTITRTWDFERNRWRK